MTPQTRAALKAYADAMEGGYEHVPPVIKELLAAYEAEPTQDELAAALAAWVQWYRRERSVLSRITPEYELARLLEPVPDPPKEEQNTTVIGGDPACLGCQGGSVTHTCGMEWDVMPDDDPPKEEPDDEIRVGEAVLIGKHVPEPADEEVEAER